MPKTVFPEWFRELLKVAEKIGGRSKPLQEALETDYQFWFVDANFMHVYTRIMYAMGVTDVFKKRIVIDISYFMDTVIKTIFHERCHALVCEELFQCDSLTYHDAYVKLGRITGYKNHPDEELCRKWEDTLFNLVDRELTRYSPILTSLKEVIRDYYRLIYNLARRKPDLLRDAHLEFPYHVVDEFVSLVAQVVKPAWEKAKNKMRKEIHKKLEPEYEKVTT